MSERVMQKLGRFLQVNPGFKDVPFIIVEGVSLSPKEAYDRLARGQTVPQIAHAMAALRFVLAEESLWNLAEAHYQRLLLKPSPRPVIVWIGGRMTIEQILEALRLRTPFSYEVVNSYQGLLQELTRRLG